MSGVVSMAASWEQALRWRIFEESVEFQRIRKVHLEGNTTKRYLHPGLPQIAFPTSGAVLLQTSFVGLTARALVFGLRRVPAVAAGAALNATGSRPYRAWSAHW